MVKYVTSCTLMAAFLFFILYNESSFSLLNISYADMVELVDTLVSGISDESHAGSSPVIRILLFSFD